MDYEIRAMRFSEILDAAFRLLRDRFVVLVGIGAVLYVPLGVINAALLRPASGPPIGELFLPGFGLYMLIAMLGGPLTQLAVTHAVSETYLGHELGIGQAYSKGFAAYLPYVGTLLLMMMGVMLASLFLILPAIYLGVAWMLVGPIAVIEDVYGPRALGRSYRLMSGNWWRGLGIVLAASLIFSVVSSGVGILFMFIPVIGPILEGLVQAIVLVFNLAVLVLLYFDLRCRHEDFDLQYLASQLAADSEPGPMTAAE
jgi:hypothetical protein